VGGPEFEIEINILKNQLNLWCQRPGADTIIKRLEQLPK
jgi:hypothetical protein